MEFGAAFDITGSGFFLVLVFGIIFAEETCCCVQTCAFAVADDEIPLYLKGCCLLFPEPHCSGDRNLIVSSVICSWFVCFSLEHEPQ